MRRRRYLGLAVGLLGGCLSDTPEPSGPRLPPRSPAGGVARGSGPTGDDTAGNDGGGNGGDAGLAVVTFDIAEGEDGDLEVPVTVENTAAGERSGTVVARATVDDETYETREEVTVAADSRVSLTLTLPVSYDSFLDGGSLSVEIETG